MVGLPASCARGAGCHTAKAPAKRMTKVRSFIAMGLDPSSVQLPSLNGEGDHAQRVGARVAASAVYPSGMNSDGPPSVARLQGVRLAITNARIDSGAAVGSPAIRHSLNR